jgi:hypothetical protein
MFVLPSFRISLRRRYRYHSTLYAPQAKCTCLGTDPDFNASVEA